MPSLYSISEPDVTEICLGEKAAKLASRLGQQAPKLTIGPGYYAMQQSLLSSGFYDGW